MCGGEDVVAEESVVEGASLFVTRDGFLAFVFVFCFLGGGGCSF